MSSKVRVAVIGLGFVSQSVHIPNLVNNDAFQIVAMCDKRHDLLESVADVFHVERRYIHYEEMLDEGGIDAVVIVVQRSLAWKIVEKCIERKLFVLSEKPLLLNHRSVNCRSVSKLDGGGVFIGYMKRHSPAVKYLETLLRDKKIISIQASCAMGDSYEGISGDLKSKYGVSMDSNDRELLPSQLKYEDLKWYEQYLNVFSHTIDICEHLAADILRLSTAMLDSHGQGQIFGKIGAAAFSLATVRRQVGQWHERVEFLTGDSVFTLYLPPAFSRDTGAKLKFNGGDQPETVVRFAEPGIRDFEFQYDAFADFVRSADPINRFQGIRTAMRHASIVEEAFVTTRP